MNIATTARLDAERAAARMTPEDIARRDARALELDAELQVLFAQAERDSRDPNDVILADAQARFPEAL